MRLRKLVTLREELHEAGGRPLEAPLAIAVAAVVIPNPWVAEDFVEDLQPVASALAPELGRFLTERVLEVLGAPAEAYGKGAIVGLDGEVEHGSALIHTLAFGNPFRDACGASTLLPAVEKRAPAGTLFDIPLKHIVDAKIRSHHQTIEVRVADAPGAGEILVALAAASGGRAHARLPSFGSGAGERLDPAPVTAAGG
jgi:hypothetical protein